MKLTKAQKKEAKSFIKNMGSNFAYAQYGRATVLMQITGPNTAKIWTSLRSVNEEKNRKWSGIYRVMLRFYNEDGMPVGFNSEYDDALDYAVVLSELFGS